ncbi:MAG TPA: hypothetical protein VMZ91_01915 [Candidatus Paceibacterota bacterium]|nr:hypothetical protein [Candidatus Paceibacterota bacterium]
MAKIIRIPNCEECLHSYTKEEVLGKSYLVCGNMDIYSIRPGIQDRIVSKTKIPDWCILEKDYERKKTIRK